MDMVSPTDELYLDCNATLPGPAPVRAALQGAIAAGLANPASGHRPGRESHRRLRHARETLAEALGARPEQVIFTSGGSEANHLALTGIPPAGTEVVCSAIEHPSILGTAALLERLGNRLVVVPCEANGVVSAERLLEAVGARTGLVSLMIANNETGLLQPVEELAEALHRRGIPLHVDAVQGLGKLESSTPVRATRTVSAHKIGGPGGIGALVLAPEHRLRALLAGGTQESGRRSGTHNLLGAIGFAAALECRSRWRAVARDAFEQSLQAAIPGCRVHGAGLDRLPNTCNVALPGVDAAHLLELLTRRGLHASTGSACRAGSPEPSHVLRAMGLAAPELRSSARFSFGPQHGAEHGFEAARRVAEAIRELEASSHGGTGP